jgi:YVTN family beta-propeller protein
MSSILFGSTMSLIDAATPSSGFIVAFDSDGIFKQKDEFGTITPITNTFSGTGLTPSFEDVLSVNNETGSYSITLSENSVIQSTNGSQLSLDSAGNPVVQLTNGYNSLLLSDVGDSYLDFILASTFSITNDSNTFRINSDMFFSSLNEIKFRVLNNSDNILIKSNLGFSMTSSNVDSNAGVIINSKNSSIDANLLNTVVIGGINLTATESNTVYLGNNVNINNAYTLPSTDGTNGQFLKTDGSGNVIWSNEIQKLSDVLQSGNETGTNNIILGTSTSLLSNSSNTKISLDWGSTNSILLSTDNGVLTDSYLLIGQNQIVLDTYSSSITTSDGLGLVYTSDYYSTFATNSLVSKKYVDNKVASVLSPNISQVLTSGNNTETLSLIMGTSTFIKSVNGGGRVDLDYGGNADRVLISTDDGAQTTSYIELNGSDIELQSNNLSINLSDNSISTSNNQGLKYATDYSSGYVNRSLVDKSYVDFGTSSIWTAISSIVSGTGSSNYVPYWSNTDEISTTSSLYLSPETTINTIQSTINVGTTPYNLKINSLNNKIYVANYGSSNLTVINSVTGLVTATISVGTNPSEILIDESTNLVWVTNRGSNNVTYINSATDTVVGTISVGSLPFGIEKVGNLIYVANQGTNNISVINTSTNLVSTTFSVTTPRTFAYDFDKNNLWVTGIGPDFVGRINLSTNTITATISVGTNPYDIVYSPNNQYLYVTNYSANSVSVINTNTLSVVSTISVGTNPDSVILDENTGYIYVSNFNSSNISVINGTSVISTISTTGNPRGLNYDYKKGKIYVSNTGLNALQSIETITRNFGFVGINSLSPKSYLDVDGKITTNSIRITDGARKGYVLTSDSGGNATWNIPILDITPGSGLTGGGTSGSVSLAIDYSVVASRSYVNVATASIWSAIDAIGATNGLSEISSGVIGLGGTLSQPTTIDLSNYDFTLNTSNSEINLNRQSTIYPGIINTLRVENKYSEIRSKSSSYESYIRVGNENNGQGEIITKIGLGTYSNRQIISHNNILLESSSTDGSNTSSLCLNSSPVSVNDFSTDNILVINDSISSKGLVYIDDYTSNYSTYSLVHKGYVDSKVSTATFKYSVTRGFTASITETITHNLGTDEVIVQAYDSTGIQVIPGLIQIMTTNSVNIMFSHTLSSIKIIVIG